MSETEQLFEVDMYDAEFDAIMEQDLSAETNANETNKAESVNDDQETDSDANETDEDDHSEVSGMWFVGIHFIF